MKKNSDLNHVQKKLESDTDRYADKHKFVNKTIEAATTVLETVVKTKEALKGLPPKCKITNDFLFDPLIFLPSSSVASSNGSVSSFCVSPSVDTFVRNNISSVINSMRLEDFHKLDGDNGMEAKMSSTIIYPELDIKSRDIKLGRRKALKRHPGNIWFQKLVASHHVTYSGLEEKQQTEILEVIVQKIKSEGRRIFKPDPKQKGYWSEASENDACEKVVNAFRTASKDAKKKEIPY